MNQLHSDSQSLLDPPDISHKPTVIQIVPPTEDHRLAPFLVWFIILVRIVLIWVGIFSCLVAFIISFINVKNIYIFYLVLATHSLIPPIDARMDSSRPL